jgi:hypothetical protein
MGRWRNKSELIIMRYHLSTMRKGITSSVHLYERRLLFAKG